MGRGTPVCYAAVSTLITTECWLVLGFLLLSLALVCPSRNADSEGQFLSGFNDPCDFSVRNVSSEAAQPVSPGPHLFPDPVGGRSPLIQ